MNFNAAFRSVIITPLESVLGRRLLSVNYWLMDFENPFFHVDKPNASGLAAISLLFEGMTMEITPAWDKILRDENHHHYIQPSVVPADIGGGELVSAQGLRKISADHAIIWRGALGKKLVGGEVYGDDQTPQAIRFSFPSTMLIMSLGYSGDKLYIGDGDELLVFSHEQWESESENSTRRMTKIW